MSNPGRRDRRDLVVVKGVQEVVYRHARTEKQCDSCVEKIKVGEEYFRVTYWAKSKGMEMFHRACFEYEFTNLPSRSHVLPDQASVDRLRNHEESEGVESTNG